MGIRCGHCWKVVPVEDVEPHLANCTLAKKGTTKKGIRYSGVSEATTQMMTRHMDKLTKKKKKYKGLMIDLSGHHGEIPQPTSESENLKQMMQHLNELRLGKMPNVTARVRSVLMARRLKHKNNFWRRH